MRILLADDHRLFRHGLRVLLEARPDMEVVAEATDGREAVELALQHTPDLVIMDVAMPRLNGVEATRKIVAECPATRVIGLSMHIDGKYTSELLKAGASGYLPKDASFEELEKAIRAVAAGDVYLSPRVAGDLIDDFVRQPRRDGSSVFEKLTSREREVLQLMSEGQSTKEIAAALHVSVKTVETHRRQIMEKLEIYSVAELTKYAIREGITSLE